jgi:hypothetical protein
MFRNSGLGFFNVSATVDPFASLDKHNGAYRRALPEERLVLPSSSKIKAHVLRDRLIGRGLRDGDILSHR